MADVTSALTAFIWIAAIVLLVVATRRRRGRRRRLGGVGSAAAGTLFDFLSQDKRNAVEIIVEERAAARDPEHKDGNLPDLAKPRQ